MKYLYACYGVILIFLNKVEQSFVLNTLDKSRKIPADKFLLLISLVTLLIKFIIR